MTPKGESIFFKKLTGGLGNVSSNWVNFYVSSPKSESLQFDGPLLSMPRKVSI